MRSFRRPEAFWQTGHVRPEAVRWGPTWEEMKLQAEWLGMRGVHFRLGQPSTVDGVQLLPQLWVYTHRWDMYSVRIGDWLVVPKQGRVRVLPNDEFAEEYQPI